MKSSSLSVNFLVLVNLIPIFGVLFLGWDLFSMMILYWMENVIIGFFNAIKMLFASKSEEHVALNIGQKVFMIPFFSVHYGIFCMVHGIFIVTLFGNGRFGENSFGKSPFELIFNSGNSLDNTFSWALLSMVLSHGLSLVLNYFRQKEYLKVSVAEQMFQPYQRIMILHVTIIFGGFVTMSMGSPVIALVFMGIVKTAVDVWAHLNEHKKIQARVLTTV